MLSSQADQGLSLAGFIDNRLALVLFTAPEAAALPDTGGIERWLGREVAMEQRFRLLAGEGEAALSKGPTICTCYQVGQFEISEAIAGGCDTVEALGDKLRCGTNCGSCIPELKQLIAAQESLEKVGVQ